MRYISHYKDIKHLVQTKATWIMKKHSIQKMKWTNGMMKCLKRNYML